MVCIFICIFISSQFLCFFFHVKKTQIFIFGFPPDSSPFDCVFEGGIFLNKMYQTTNFEWFRKTVGGKPPWPWRWTLMAGGRRSRLRRGVVCTKASMAAIMFCPSDKGRQDPAWETHTPLHPHPPHRSIHPPIHTALRARALRAPLHPQPSTRAHMHPVMHRYTSRQKKCKKKLNIQPKKMIAGSGADSRRDRCRRNGIPPPSAAARSLKPNPG